MSARCISRCAFGQITSSLSFAICKMGAGVPATWQGQDGIRGSKGEKSRGKVIWARFFLQTDFSPLPQDLSQRGVWKFNRASQSGS